MLTTLPDRFAVIADVHGNSWALEAVLDEIDRRAVSAIVDLGDSVYGPLDPAGTIALLRDREIPSLRGNQDRLTLSTRSSNPTWSFVRRQLVEKDLEWLGSLPPVRSLGEVLLCHGTPSSDSTYLLETVEAAGARPASSREVLSRLDGSRARLVCCGHSHLPRLVDAGGVTVVNPGSVGLPAYDDDSPHPHAMEAGSAHARFAIVERRGVAWRVDLCAVPYDWQRAAVAAEDRDRGDWARWLRTGFARSDG